MTQLTLAWAITLSSAFEGGNIRDYQQVAPGHFRIALPGESDQEGRNRQANWYSFRLDGVRGKPLTIELTRLEGEYNYRPNKGAVTGDTPPYYSLDGRAWKPWEDFTYDGETPKLVLRMTPQSDRLWVAHIPPYTSQHLDALRRDAARHPAFREEVIGRTAGGRPMHRWRITAPGDAAGRKVIWLMARQHSWEASTSWVAEGLVRYLLSDDAQAARIRRETVFVILPMCDPDGVARGGVRFNAHGFDLNRNWDSFVAEKMPEIAAQHAAVKSWLAGGGRIDLFLTMHNTETAEYLEGPPGGRFQALGERLYSLLEQKTSFAPARGLSWAETTTTAGKPGRMTVVQGLWKDFRIPAFLTEQRVSFNAKLGRRPLTEDRLRYGGELAAALWMAVSRE
ncbi:MAG: hypothetical protein HY858_15435 [Candidatus Solibacter usitatus]|nr:hypothetical protein [Candidatus Solibacter usitatus]